MPSHFWGLPSILCGAFLLTLGHDAVAGEKFRSVSGVVTEVDAEKRVVGYKALDRATNRWVTASIALDRNCPISVGGGKADLDSIRPGQQISFSVSSLTNTAVRLSAAGSDDPTALAAARIESTRKAIRESAQQSEPPVGKPTTFAKLSTGGAAPVYPDDELRLYRTGRAYGYDMDTVFAIHRMSPKEAAALREVAIRQGHEWDRLPLEKKLPIAKEIIKSRAHLTPANNPRISTASNRGRQSGPEGGEGDIRAAVLKMAVAGLFQIAKDEASKRDDLLSAFGSVAFKNLRNSHIDGALKDLFPDMGPVAKRALARVISQQLDRELTLRNLAFETAKDEIVEALKKEHPELAKCIGAVKLVYELHCELSRR
jgi:hypothetical protein